MAVRTQLVTGPALARTAAQPAPDPPIWHASNRIAAWLPTGEFHRMFPGVLVYERPGERRYFIPAQSRIWNYSSKGWSSWTARTGSYKRFVEGRWWNETILRDRAYGRYYDIATPALFLPDGVAYVDLYLDVEKRRGRTIVVDRDEWEAFRRHYPLAPELAPLVEVGMHEAARYGPSSWRAALERMEGECRRWVRDQVRRELDALGVTPGRRPLAASDLAILVSRINRLTGAALLPARLAGEPTIQLGHAIFRAMTRDPVRPPRMPLRREHTRPPRRVPTTR
jgi:protein associated with RNAse G/E